MAVIDEILRFLFQPTVYGIPLWAIILVLAIIYYLWVSSRRRR